MRFLVDTLERISLLKLLFTENNFPKDKKLITKLLFHGFFAFLYFHVLVYGFKIMHDITEEEMVSEDIQNLKWYGLCFGTNWNYSTETTQCKTPPENEHVLKQSVNLKTTLVNVNVLADHLNKEEQRRMVLKLQVSKRRSRNHFLMDEKLITRTLFHGYFAFLNFFVLVYGLKIMYDINDEQLESENIQNLKWFGTCFYTNWNYFFQFMFLCCALAHDVLEWGGKQDSARGKKIRYYRDVIFSGMVVPITMFVVVMFWSLYTIDRELVFPEVFDNIVPRWFNHCVHTNILVLVAAETLLQPRRKPADLRAERICYVTISVLYAVVYYSIYFFGNRWLYKVFGLLTWWQVVLFQLLIWGSTHVFYVMQFPINRLIHGSEPEDEKVVENHQKEVEKEVETETKEEVEKSLANGIQAKGEFRNAPFADKSWSLKYRSIRDQFENSRL